MSTITKQDIEAAAEKLAAARAQLEKALARASHAQAQQRAKWSNQIEPLREVMLDAHDDLQLMLESAKDLFVKPKSMTSHEVNVGYRKGKDRIEKDMSDKDVITMIRRALPGKQNTLIQTKECLDMHAAENLTDAELAKVGLRRVEGTDTPFVKPLNGSVETIYSSLFGHSIYLVEGE